jgi:hypothetical protein
MKPPIPGLKNELLVVADRHGELSATVARREGAAWKIVARENHRGDLPALLATLRRQRRLPAQALLVSTACRPALLAMEIAPSLSATESAELLRWEVDEVLRDAPPLPEESLADPGDPIWRAGHAAAAAGHTFIAAQQEAVAARWSADFAAQGVPLAGIVPWLAAALPCAAEKGRPLILWAHSGAHLALFAVRRGAVEFFGTCAAEEAAFRRTLARDARSFEAARTVLIAAERDAAQLRVWLAAEKLPAAEPLPEPLDTDWPFLGALAAARGASALPAINLLPPPPPVWQRPAAWWAAAAALLLIFALPLLLRWRGELATIAKQRARLAQETKSVQAKIEEIRASTDEFAALKRKHDEIEQEISRQRRGGVLPSDSAFAQPEYVASALRAIAEACAGRARLSHFTIDYEGKLILKGNAASDTAVQKTTSAFFSRLEKFKEFKYVPVTTKRRADEEPGLDFEVSETASAATFGSSGAITPQPSENAP